MDVVFVVGALVFFLLMVGVAVVSGRSGRRSRSADWSGGHVAAWSGGWSGGDGGSSGGGDGGGGGGGCGGGG